MFLPICFGIDLLILNFDIEMIEIIVSQIISTAIGSSIAAIILRAAAKWVIKEDISFGDAYITVFLSSIICAVLGFIIGLVVVAVGLYEGNESLLPLVILPFAFLIQSGIISSRLSTSFKTACIITLVMIAIAIGIAIIVSGIVFLVLHFTS